MQLFRVFFLGLRATGTEWQSDEETWLSGSQKREKILTGCFTCRKLIHQYLHSGSVVPLCHPLHPPPPRIISLLVYLLHSVPVTPFPASPSYFTLTLSSLSNTHNDFLGRTSYWTFSNIYLNCFWKIADLLVFLTLTLTTFDFFTCVSAAASHWQAKRLLIFHSSHLATAWVHTSGCKTIHSLSRSTVCVKQ